MTRTRPTLTLLAFVGRRASRGGCSIFRIASTGYAQVTVAARQGPPGRISCVPPGSVRVALGEAGGEGEQLVVRRRARIGLGEVREALA